MHTTKKPEKRTTKSGDDKLQVGTLFLICMVAIFMVLLHII